MSITRIYDAHKIAEITSFLLKSTQVIDSVEWVGNQQNIALQNDRGDFAIFECGLNGRRVYSGHYYFKSRGKEAILAGKEFLDFVFNSCYNIGILMGLVPVKRKDARWMTRQLGFTSYGFDEAHGTEYELFILTKKEFNNE
jgi:hypothetical protein